MSEEEFENKTRQIIQIMEENGIYTLDDYFTTMYMSKTHEYLFRVTSQRFYESQQEADDVLDEILTNLINKTSNP